jgi:holo-ACP synthase
VGLEQVLANRERRAARQQAALARYQSPVISLTLVIPGPRKDSPEARFLLETALLALDGLLLDRGWPVLMAEARFQATGPEALRAVAADPMELKRALTALEDVHPLGRLWDLDVIVPAVGALSRQSLGLPPRRCLVCQQPAHACARSQAHPLAALTTAIACQVRAYRAQGTLPEPSSRTRQRIRS